MAQKPFRATRALQGSPFRYTLSAFDPIQQRSGLHASSSSPPGLGRFASHDNNLVPSFSLRKIRRSEAASVSSRCEGMARSSILV
jgi:hypothetical protein